MSAGLIAKRYAKALLTQTESSPVLIEKAVRFFSLCDELFTIPESKRILKSPVMPPEVKKAILGYAAQVAGNPSDYTAFIANVVDAGRTHLIPEMATAFSLLVTDRLGVADALVKSSEQLTEKQSADLVRSLESVFRKKIKLKNEVDQKILGGVMITVGNYVIDLSLKSQLNALAEVAQR